LLLILSAIIIPGSIIYYFYQLNAYSLSFIIILISGMICFFWLKNKKPTAKIQISWPKLNFIQSAVFVGYLLLIVFLFKILIDSRSGLAVPTPWTLIDKRIFILYFSATFILLIFFFNCKLNKCWKKILLSVHFFFSFSVAFTVYRLGFGYDPFIHQKTVEIISQNGYILPKPFYYLGQWTLEVFIHKTFLISVNWLDKLLLPVLSAVLMPAIFIDSIKKIKPSAVLFFLAIPYSFFTFTTPQNLCLLFSLIIIFLSWRYLNQKNLSWWWLGSLSVVSLLIHPLTGLPVFLFALGVYFFKNPTKLKSTFKIALAIFSSAVIPLAFWFLNLLGRYRLSFDFNSERITNNLSDFFSNLFYLKNNFRSVFDLIYFYGFNWRIFMIILITVCFIVFRKKIIDIFNHKKNFKLIKIYLIAFIITGINYVLLKNLLVFEELIYYERFDYAKRLIILMFFFLYPVFLIFISYIADKIRKKTLFIRLSFSCLAALLITAGFYLSYPRYDNIFATHGRNVSIYDFSAVQLIKEKETEKYSVLASQNTSVAAVRLYGFSPIYNGQFYFPIPTGSKLYQCFLNMVNDQPKIEYIRQAKKITDVSTIYFVIPAYWHNSEQIIKQAKNLADKHYSIENQIHIFKFD